MTPERSKCLAAATRRRFRLHPITLSLVLVLLAGCAGSRLYQALAPSVAVSDITVDHISFVEQAFTVALRVSNPNGFALPVAGIDYSLQVDGKQVVDGQSIDGFTLPANGSQVVQLSLAGDFLNTLDLFQSWREAGSKMLDYELTGHIRLAGVPISLPFSYADSIALRLP